MELFFSYYTVLGRRRSKQKKNACNILLHYGKQELLLKNKIWGLSWFDTSLLQELIPLRDARAMTCWYFTKVEQFYWFFFLVTEKLSRYEENVTKFCPIKNCFLKSSQYCRKFMEDGKLGQEALATAQKKRATWFAVNSFLVLTKLVRSIFSR